MTTATRVQTFRPAFAGTVADRTARVVNSSRASGGCSAFDNGRVARVRTHLTRRGRAVVATVVAAPLIAIGVFAGQAAIAAAPGATETHITVSDGDTLWSIAKSYAPNADTRDVVRQIMILNDLPSADVHAGESLALPPQR